jgi:hypothetical protein
MTVAAVDAGWAPRVGGSGRNRGGDVLRYIDQFGQTPQALPLHCRDAHRYLAISLRGRYGSRGHGMARSAKVRKVAEPLISPIKAVATYELVADQLRNSIILSRFLPGQKLPPERHLAAQLGVSRTTVREAVRAVEAEGWSKRGAAQPAASSSGRGSSTATSCTVSSRRTTKLTSIFEFACPPNAPPRARGGTAHRQGARCAARNLRSHAEADGNAKSRSHVPNIAPFVADDNAFHLAIARASRNPYLQAAVETARAQMFLPIGAVFERLEDNANDFLRRSSKRSAGRMPMRPRMRCAGISSRPATG